jgi:hypothetical protein
MAGENMILIMFLEDGDLSNYGAAYQNFQSAVYSIIMNTTSLTGKISFVDHNHYCK